MGSRFFSLRAKANREACEERRRRYAELQRRHNLARGRVEREQARAVFAEEIVKLTREAESLRAWPAKETLAEISNVEGQVARFGAWMRNRLRSIERQLDPARLERVLVEKKLFPTLEEDELHDPEGDPP